MSRAFHRSSRGRELMWARYGIKLNGQPFLFTDYERISAEQEGKCARCGHVHFLVPDHNHDTGEFNALLCRGCNSTCGLRGWNGITRSLKAA